MQYKIITCNSQRPLFYLCCVAVWWLLCLLAQNPFTFTIDSLSFLHSNWVFGKNCLQHVLGETTRFLRRLCISVFFVCVYYCLSSKGLVKKSKLKSLTALILSYLNMPKVQNCSISSYSNKKWDEEENCGLCCNETMKMFNYRKKDDKSSCKSFHFEHLTLTMLWKWWS